MIPCEPAMIYAAFSGLAASRDNRQNKAAVGAGSADEFSTYNIGLSPGSTSLVWPWRKECWVRYSISLCLKVAQHQSSVFHQLKQDYRQLRHFIPCVCVCLVYAMFAIFQLCFCDKVLSHLAPSAYLVVIASTDITAQKCPD